MQCELHSRAVGRWILPHETTVPPGTCDDTTTIDDVRIMIRLAKFRLSSGMQQEEHTHSCTRIPSIWHPPPSVSWWRLFPQPFFCVTKTTCLHFFARQTQRSKLFSPALAACLPSSPRVCSLSCSQLHPHFQEKNADSDNWRDLFGNFTNSLMSIAKSTKHQCRQLPFGISEMRLPLPWRFKSFPVMVHGKVL